MPQIGLLTDFGSRGMHYIAEMKGVALQINPDARIIDITHSIKPYSIIEASYILQTIVPRFPKDTIFVCVVDPGVGSDRDIFAVELTSGHIIVGPNNGIFTPFLIKHKINLIIKITESEFYYKSAEIDMGISPDDQREVKMQIPEFRESKSEHEELADLFEEKEHIPERDLPVVNPPLGVDSEMLFPDLPQPKPPAPISSTFHGRDIMMPIAAHLSKGLSIFTIGEPIEDIEAATIQIEDYEPIISDDHRILTGMVLYVDAFENIITNIPIREFNLVVQDWPSSFELKINQRIFQLKKTEIFAGNSPESLLLIPGSSGFLEICMNLGRAATKITAEVGMKFELEILPKGEVHLP